LKYLQKAVFVERAVIDLLFHAIFFYNWAAREIGFQGFGFAGW
jgi:hypothetical protein